MKKLLLFTDGGSRNNPGPAGIGGVGFDTVGREAFRYKQYLGEKTNNQAEYLSLIKGLTLAAAKGYESVECFLDSELVVKQLTGLYKIKHQDLKPLAVEVMKLTNNFKNIGFTHVPREKNKIADQLVNEAIDAAMESPSAVS